MEITILLYLFVKVKHRNCFKKKIDNSEQGEKRKVKITCDSAMQANINMYVYTFGKSGKQTHMHAHLHQILPKCNHS